MPLIPSLLRRVLRGGLILCVLAVPAVTFGAADASATDEVWQAGLSRVVITPDEPMWLSGYGGRSKPAEGRVQDLYVRVAALRDPAGHTAVLVSTDLIGVPIRMVEAVMAAVGPKHNLERSQVMFTCSHTHCGPALDDQLSHMLAMEEQDWEQVRAYQQQLNAKLIAAIDAAIADLQPARLSTGQGTCGFASNRRPPIGLGPYDHDVPVLLIQTPDGSRVRGMTFAYACHNTTLGFDFWCGDYAGFAAEYLEDRFPGAVAVFHTGCGADQNPLPRRTLELCQKYGRMLAIAVEEVVGGEMTPVSGRLRTAFRNVDLEFSEVPGRDFFEKQLESSNRYERNRARFWLNRLDRGEQVYASYPFPAQVWRLGPSVTWIALGGETCVDYSLRLKKELGRESTWVTGYANDVMCYIPSERVLEEGGYEGASSMIVYQMPSPWKPGLEERIVDAVHELVRQTGR